MTYYRSNQHYREHDLRRIFSVHIDKYRQKSLSHIAQQSQCTAQYAAITERIGSSIVLVGTFGYYVLMKQL